MASPSKSRTNNLEIQYTKSSMVGQDGVQFERLIGLTKHSLYKSIGRSQLTYNELEEILLDVEINLDNRLLTYVEDEIQLNVFTPNSMILGRDVRTINFAADSDSDEWTKRQRYVQRCKENACKRWKHEYPAALRERQNFSHKGITRKVKIGDIVMIKGESKNRGHWKIGKVSQLYTGKDEVVRAVQIQVETKFLVRPIQLLYPLELHCDVPAREVKEQVETNFNVDAKEFRPRHNAAAIVDARIQDINATNDDESSI